jgi:hypothetical protein
MNSDGVSGHRAGSYLYNNTIWPCRSALNWPYSSQYLAFRLPSRNHSPANEQDG